jgi:hypothetical protein
MRIGLVIGVMLAVAGPALGASLPPRQPGLWQSTTTVTGPDGKPLPNAINVVTVSCVDATTDLKFFLSNESACSSFALTGAGSQYEIDGSCTQDGRPVTIHETLNYESNEAVTLVAALSSPGGPLTVTTQLQWQGDCLAGMEPGDEGSMINGAFSKADNINDAANQ